MGNYYSGMMNATGGSELRHHGILGQKWGVRRFQNKDGTWTEAGKKRRRSEYDGSGYSKVNVIPNVSVNGIAYGEDRELIRNKRLGDPDRTFKKTSKSEGSVDAYPGLHVYYSKDRKMEGMEFFNKTHSINIGSKQIFPGSLSNAKKSLPDLEENFGSYVSKKASIAFSVDDDGNIDSIFVGKRGYYQS